MTYVIPLIVENGTLSIKWNWSTVDFGDEFDEKEPTPEQMASIRKMAEMELCGKMS